MFYTEDLLGINDLLRRTFTRSVYSYRYFMSVLRSFQIAHEARACEALSWFQKSVFFDTPPYFLTHWKTNKKFFYSNKRSYCL